MTRGNAPARATPVMIPECVTSVRAAAAGTLPLVGYELAEALMAPIGLGTPQNPAQGSLSPQIDINKRDTGSSAPHKTALAQRFDK